MGYGQKFYICNDLPTVMPKPKLSGPKPYRDFHPGRPNVWGMIQTIAITAIGRGQFVLAIVAAVILAIIIKMPGEQVYLYNG